MNKFLDEENIIKKETDTPIEEEMDLGLEETINEQPIIEEKPKKQTKKRKVPKIIEEKPIIQPKSRLEILVKLINRYNEQLITKEIDLDLAHYLYNNGGSNDERKRYQMIIQNLAKDIREMQKKIEFLNNKYNKEK
jgi:hypothetical protein